MAQKQGVPDFQAVRLKWRRCGVNNHWQLWKLLGGVHADVRDAVADIAKAEPEEDKKGLYVDVVDTSARGVALRGR